MPETLSVPAPADNTILPTPDSSAGSDGVNTEMDVRSSSGMDIPAIRRETLQANRALVKSSRFRQALGAIDAELVDVPATPKPLGHIAQATTEKEMHRAILKESHLRGDNGIDTWAANGSPSIKWACVLFPFLLLLSPALFLDSFEVCALIFGMGFIPAAVSAAGTADNGLGNPAARLQNRVLKRKAYRMEVRRLMGVAEDARNQRERFIRIRKAKLNALAKALSPLAEDYSSANPGTTLAILDDGVKPAIEVINDTTYNKLDRIAASTILGEIDA